VRPIRVFIISDSLLFVQGLKSLLTHETKLEIVGEETTMERAVEQIELLGPDVIILSENSRVSDSALEEMFLLRAKPGIKVIGLSLQNNGLFIYLSARRDVESLEDLVKAIESDAYLAESSYAQYKAG
jgi:two-component system nitrate/nitrite response regulator NarL